MIFNAALTKNIYPRLTINVPSSFPNDSESGYKSRMNEILFTVGDLPIHVGEALAGFGVLALVLLLAIEGRQR